MNRRKNNDGVALIVVVGLVALLTAIVVGVQAQVARSLRAMSFQQNFAAAQRMAELGISAGVLLIQYDDEEDRRSDRGSEADYFFSLPEGDALEVIGQFKSMREIWSLFRPGAGAPLERLGLTGNFLPIGENGGVEISIEDHSGRWNVNRLFRERGIKMDDPEVRAAIAGATRLLGDAGQGRQFVAAAIDWVDRDSEQIDPKGAESSYYETLTPPYQARNGQMQHIEEIRALRGVDEKAYEALVSAVTTWPSDLRAASLMPLNINTASEQALAFLDEEIDDNVIRRIIEARDRQPFRKDSEVQKFFSDELGLKNLWTRVMGRYLVSVRSRVFVVRAIGYVGDDRAVQEAVIDRDPTTGKIRVLMRRWRSF